MKTIFLMLCLSTAFVAQSQQTIKYFDYKWKECDISLARFYSVRTKTDTGILVNDVYLATKQLQMAGLYADDNLKIKNGLFTYFYPNKKVSSTGNYKNGKKDGTWLSYHYNGMIEDSTTYLAGQPIQTYFAWHNNGIMSDSIVYGADGLDVYVSWFDNGNPAESGRKLEGKKEGTWQYFYKNSNLAAKEQYSRGVLLKRIYYDEQGAQLADTTNHDAAATFKGGEKGWKKYMENNLVFPTNVKLINTSIITVVIDATVDEDGNVRDLYIEVPFDPLFDNEALRVMKKSPKWQSAIRYNRKVKTFIRQPVSFSQTED